MKYLIALILTLTLPFAQAMPLFELQAQSGQLWTAIKAHLDAKDAQIAALTADLEKIKAAADDPVKLEKELKEIRKVARQRRVDDATAKRDAAQAELDAAKATPAAPK